MARTASSGTCSDGVADPVHLWWDPVTRETLDGSPHCGGVESESREFLLEVGPETLRFNRSVVDGDHLDLAKGGKRPGVAHAVLHDGAADDVRYPQHGFHGPSSVIESDRSAEGSCGAERVEVVTVPPVICWSA